MSFFWCTIYIADHTLVDIVMIICMIICTIPFSAFNDKCRSEALQKIFALTLDSEVNGHSRTKNRNTVRNSFIQKKNFTYFFITAVEAKVKFDQFD